MVAKLFILISDDSFLSLNKIDRRRSFVEGRIASKDNFELRVLLFKIEKW
jgi:hypothetical protein